MKTKTKERLIKEVQSLSVARHSKKELMRLTEEQLKDIIKFKRMINKKWPNHL